MSNSNFSPEQSQVMRAVVDSRSEMSLRPKYGRLPPQMFRVPIVVDGVSRRAARNSTVIEQWSMSRCVFFEIVVNIPVPNIDLQWRSMSYPMYLMGMRGIIAQPSLTSLEFQNADEIDSLINQIEFDGNLTVETGTVMIPTRLLDDAAKEATTKPARRGQVFRIEPTIFAQFGYFPQQWQNLDPDLTEDELSRRASGRVKLSDGETRVFSEWTRRQFRNNRPGKNP